MRFLRLKPRRVDAAVATMGTSGVDEEEEGRQGLLPHASKDEQSSAYLHNNLQASSIIPEAPPATSNLKQLPAPAASNCSTTNTQVVLLKASLHCQGCTRRLKKSLSKLQGVNTFHIDMEHQKVTVIGTLCPDDVLQSVNKVMKGSQFWEASNT